MSVEALVRAVGSVMLVTMPCVYRPLQNNQGVVCSQHCMPGACLLPVGAARLCPRQHPLVTSA